MKDADRRSEVIERAALVSLHEHCPDPTREALGLFLEPVSDGLCAGASRDPSILLNRELGLGVQRPPSQQDIVEIAKIYADRDVQRFFLHIYPDSVPEDDGAAWKAAAGLESTRGWMKFLRPPDPPVVRTTELRVERVGPDRAHHFGQIVAKAFGMTEAAGPLLAGLGEDPRWHLFVSYDGDAPAGAGGLMIEDGVGWLEWGATDPAFRRRGSQGAIMMARVQAAIDAGCDLLCTETGEAVPGDPQHSYTNIERAGFVPSTLRLNWAPPRR